MWPHPTVCLSKEETEARGKPREDGSLTSAGPRDLGLLRCTALCLGRQAHGGEGSRAPGPQERSSGSHAQSGPGRAVRRAWHTRSACGACRGSDHASPAGSHWSCLSERCVPDSVLGSSHTEASYRPGREDGMWSSKLEAHRAEAEKGLARAVAGREH